MIIVHIMVDYHRLRRSWHSSGRQARSQRLCSRSGDTTTLDEVQHVPELFSVIKTAMDGMRQPRRFLLTGSANVMLLPKLSGSLAGRMEILTLWPCPQGELRGARQAFLDTLFSRKPVSWIGKPALLRGDV